MKILLAIDDSDCSRTATTALRDQFKPKDTTVRVVHVIEWPRDLPAAFSFAEGPMAAAVVLDSQEGTRRKAKNLVDDAATRLRAARFEADGLVVEGDVSDALLDMAADWGADLIVLGSHGRRGLDRLLLGSVSDVVLRHTTCSVLIVRPPAAGADAAKRPGAGAAEYGRRIRA